MAVAGLVALAPLLSRTALQVGGASLMRSATRAVGSGAAFQAGAELVYAIAEWARSVDGDWNSEGQQPNDGIGPTEGCWKVDGGAGLFEERESSDLPFTAPPGAQCNVVSASAAFVEFNPDNGLNTYTLSRTYTNQASDSINISRSPSWQWRVNPACSGGSCSSDPYPGTGQPPTDPIDLGPIQDGDCTINVKFMGFLGNQDGPGNVEPVWYIEPVPDLRASGGVIVGECNFSPTVMVGGGGDGKEPPRTYPSPPFDPGGDEWWRSLAAGLAGGLAASLIDSLIENIFTAQGPASFTLTAPCNKDSEGNPETYTVEFPAESYAERMISWQIAGADLLQQHLNWKTPICKDVPQLEGDYRTISFRSDETSPYGKSRLRKRFRYRSVSGNDLSAVVDHWKDFSWEGGPYRVRWVGGPWRSPEIWAATEAEGKRVIQHAAAEAGFSPLEGGRWSTRLSGSGRQGVPGTMRVDTTKGFYWITARDGSDQRPIVAKT